MAEAKKINSENVCDCLRDCTSRGGVGTSVRFQNFALGPVQAVSVSHLTFPSPVRSSGCAKRSSSHSCVKLYICRHTLGILQRESTDLGRVVVEGDETRRRRL